jgi:hypothetical protein
VKGVALTRREAKTGNPDIVHLKKQSWPDVLHHYYEGHFKKPFYRANHATTLTKDSQLFTILSLPECIGYSN